MLKMLRNTLTPLRNMDETHFWENKPFCDVSPEPKLCKPEIKKPIKKKIKRIRTAFTTKQLRALELLFTQNKYINPERRREISKALNLGDKSVKIWFQNRRMKEKRESSESSRVDSDASNETFACEKSPPSVVSTETYTPLQNEVTANGNISPESCQYQAPQFYANNINEQQMQNVYASNYNSSQANGMQFYYDSNLYPTQYYPFNGVNYPNDNNYYHQDKSIHNNYWNSNYTPCYFYNEGV